MTFIAYYRVSTTKQGSSGLGIDAQRRAVANFLGRDTGRVVEEFVEVESGRHKHRPQLDRALRAARLHRAPLVVAKVDRLTRSVSFLSKLLEAGVDVRFADLPQIEGPTGRFMLQQLAAVAELEAGLISQRTKAALAVAKDRGVTLGGYRGTSPNDQAREAGRLARQQRSRQRAHDLAPLLASLMQDNPMSNAAVARSLNQRGIPTGTGRGQWTSGQVKRIQALIEHLTHPEVVTNEVPTSQRGWGIFTKRGV
jgi:DNA invertase Pin-like site-specific DNA recombinase